MPINWQETKDTFEEIDVRKLTGNFLPLILKKAHETNVGEGLCMVQSFEPIPLYSALAELGFDHLTEKVSDTEYRVYFHRAEAKGGDLPGGMDTPLKPTAILNFKKIDDKLADIVVGFWSYIWESEKPAIDQKTRYLLSLANGVGAGRLRQATREFVKGYATGVTIAEFDELFAMFAWNQGIGYFASEIGPSTLFAAYQTVKDLEARGKSRGEIMETLMKTFGEKNPDVGTLPKSR